MNKHTPGPWKAEPFAGGWNVWPISSKKPDGSAIAYDCTEADARLIAAAPDLLAALLALVERGTDSPEHMAAEAAIAKATGEAA